MRKGNLVMIGCAAVMLLGCTAFGAEAELMPGVTVAENPESATGYTVTFVYEEAEATSVDLIGTFAFYEEGSKMGELPEEYIPASEWEPGMFRASNSDLAVSEAMEKVEGTDYWQVSLDLPSGHYLYNYKVDGAEETIPDPANAPMASTAETGNASKLSTVDVPYAEVQGSSIDFDFMMQREEGEEGTLVYTDYTDINGNLAPLAIYLPYGYDAERAEGYKTLYLSHGAGGTEMEWFASGNTQYVFDNLIQDGDVEPTIVVTMNNTAYSWDFDVINQNVMECIIPYMEANYNVGTEPVERAFAGLSMGGQTTSNVLYQNGDQFGYVGILSGSDTTNFFFRDKEKMSAPVIMLGAGCYDFGISTGMALSSGSAFGLQYLQTGLSELGIDYDMYVVKGGHDWTVWPQLIKIFATDYLWK